MIEFRIEPNEAMRRLIAQLADSRRLLARAFTPQLQALGVELVGKIKPATPADTGALRAANRWTVVPEQLTLILFNSLKYSLYVHDGTKHTRAPPVEALLQWARRRVQNGAIAATGKALTGKTRRDAAWTMAFLVARAIKRRGGLKPRPFIRGTIAANLAAVKGAVERGQRVFVALMAGRGNA